MPVTKTPVGWVCTGTAVLGNTRPLRITGMRWVKPTAAGHETVLLVGAATLWHARADSTLRDQGSTFARALRVPSGAVAAVQSGTLYVYGYEWPA